MNTTLGEPICISEDGGALTGDILFTVANTGPEPLRDLSIIDQRTISTAGGMLFLRLVVCPASSGTCEFRPDSPDNASACRFSLGVGETFSCGVPQTVTSSTHSFGENAALTGSDACGNPLKLEAIHVTHVTCGF